jgi:CheY-like chemotaxis protein
MDKKAIFRDHVLKTDVLIVDKNPSSRNRLLKIMYDLGCNRARIHTAGHLQEAEELVKTKPIGIVLSDYFIGGGSGFDLFKMIRAQGAHNKHLTLILVTSNISQTAVAKAAEEDVDSFIIKPYTIQSIEENLISTIASKVKPSAYVLKTEEGKDLIERKMYKEAIIVLEEALKLHPKPALALSYIGQAQYLQEMMDTAEDSYGAGLKLNNIHYKCLIGLYTMFMERELWNEAYQVVKKIAKFFPANPDRLAEIIRLAVRTENFEDMQMYYEIFTALDERNEMMIKYIGAGMYVSGKHLLFNSKIEDALKIFEQIAVSCSEFPKIIRGVITSLVDYAQVEQAEKYLMRFAAGSDENPDFLISEFLVMSHKSDASSSTIAKQGLELFNKEVKDPQCLKIMIEHMEKCEYKAETIRRFKTELESIGLAA